MSFQGISACFFMHYIQTVKSEMVYLPLTKNIAKFIQDSFHAFFELPIIGNLLISSHDTSLFFCLLSELYQIYLCLHQQIEWGHPRVPVGLLPCSRVVRRHRRLSQCLSVCSTWLRWDKKFTKFSYFYYSIWQFLLFCIIMVRQRLFNWYLNVDISVISQFNEGSLPKDTYFKTLVFWG